MTGSSRKVVGMEYRFFPIVNGGDLRSTQEFYQRLGFEKTFQFPLDGEPGYVSMARGEVSIGIGAGEGEPFSVWSYVEDVDRIIEELRLAGVEIVDEPVDQPWGERVAEVRDPTGILVHLANAAS